MRGRRYHILIVREDGKQYHNRILEWIQVRRHMTVLGAVVGLLVLGNVGFFSLASWQGSLLLRARLATSEKARLEKQFASLGKSLDEAQRRIADSEQKLAQMQELARQQNLHLPPVAGVGGPSPHARPSAEVPVTPSVAEIVERSGDVEAQAREISQATSELMDVLRPHLNNLAHTPSIWPVKGFVASGFGERQDPIGGEEAYHAGMDISAPYGSPVQAPAEGLVLEVGWKAGYGNTIVIGHGNGLTTLYGHLSQVLVEPGRTVKRWQRIGLVGTSGRTTGAHLHYEVHRDGQAVNPARYLLY